MHWIYDLPLWALCTLVLALTVLYAVGAVLAVRRLRWRLDADDNATAAALHAFIGVLYAVALGLLVVSAQDDNGDVEKAVSAEANATGNLYRVTAGLEPANRVRLRREIADYVRLVIVDEWPATQHARPSAATWRAIDRLGADVYTFVPAGAQEERVYPQLVGELEEVLDARRERLYLGQQGVGAVTWTIIVLGGMITIGFAAFFRMGSVRPHLLLTGLAAAMFGLMLFLLLAMDHPLWGRVSIDPGPFHELEASFARQQAEMSAPQPR
ncbi:MAG TPA: hypothetical protein VGO40_01985 [Longimicrobium sp.]|jgi:hypothetical protein|nr:hypothetical protein [Longimicrobium sp.]